MQLRVGVPTQRQRCSFASERHDARIHTTPLKARSQANIRIKRNKNSRFCGFLAGCELADVLDFAGVTDGRVPLVGALRTPTRT